MRECLPRAIRNRPASRVNNKGGAIAVVKSTESLNSWYRTIPSPPPPFGFSPRVIPHEITRRETGLLPFFSRTLPGGLGDYVTRIRMCVSLLTGNLERFCLPPSLSFSRSPERESIMLKSRWVERNSTL